MGQKVSPIGFRILTTQKWKSRWFARKDFAKYLAEDIKVRKFMAGRLASAGISRIEIERTGEKMKIDIHTARPGIVIGRKGAEVDVLRDQLEKITGKQVAINILEVSRPEIDANLVAQGISEQLKARVSFRRAMKKAVSSALRGGAKGIRISCSGRLGGAEMARNEWYREGRVPLQTLRADIDYGFAEAFTTFGQIGVKVWIYKGELRPGAVNQEPAMRRSARKMPGKEYMQNLSSDAVPDSKAAIVEAVEEIENPIEIDEEVVHVDVESKPVITSESKATAEAESKPKKTSAKKAEKETTAEPAAETPEEA